MTGPGADREVVISPFEGMGYVDSAFTASGSRVRGDEEEHRECPDQRPSSVSYVRCSSDESGDEEMRLALVDVDITRMKEGCPFSDDQLVFMKKMISEVIKRDVTEGWPASAYRENSKKYRALTRTLVDEVKVLKAADSSSGSVSRLEYEGFRDTAMAKYNTMSKALGNLFDSKLSSRVVGLEEFRDHINTNLKGVRPDVHRDIEQSGFDRCVKEIAARGYFHNGLLEDASFMKMVRDKESLHLEMDRQRSQRYLYQKRNRFDRVREARISGQNTGTLMPTAAQRNAALRSHDAVRRKLEEASRAEVMKMSAEHEARESAQKGVTLASTAPATSAEIPKALVAVASRTPGIEGGPSSRDEDSASVLRESKRVRLLAKK